MQRLPGRQALQVPDEAVHLFVQGRLLLVRTDDILALPPSVSIGFSFGARFGSHSNSMSNHPASSTDSLAVWLESSSSSRATCQPR